MKLKFYKYQGAGNDFIIFDNRSGSIQGDQAKWYARICDRRFGIGADGVMLLQDSPDADFEMVYYNADGCESSMCGNGGRCMVNFARQIGFDKELFRFVAVDGVHEAVVKNNIVELKMNDVENVKLTDGGFELNTGSPHLVLFIEDLQHRNIHEMGKEIRYSDAYKSNGINVNFIELINDSISIRTYERGVEDETLSCGTGVTAAALAVSIEKNYPPGKYTLNLHTMGGDLQVRFAKISDQHFTDIWLIGPGEFVFEGEVESD